MGAEAAPGGVFRALLVGIDAYDAVRRLGGSVNDVERYAQWLQSHSPLPVCLRKLVAPVEQQPAERDRPTYDNIKAELQALAAQARPGDRTLFYYSGHGTAKFSAEARAPREALVPWDFNGGGQLLWDVELGPLLDAVFQASGDLTVILDACNSAGATRVLPVDASSVTRYIEPPATSAVPASLKTAGRALGEPDEAAPGLRSTSGYAVIAAAHSFQPANEAEFPPQGKSGVMTNALLQVLTERKAEVQTLRWMDIWPQVCALVAERSPQQQPALIGPTENRVLGGPPGERVVGFSLRRLPGEPAVYEVDAGDLLGVSAGALLIVYPRLPAGPPPTLTGASGVPALGMLQVSEATDWRARAAPLAGKPAFSLESSACALLHTTAPDSSLVVGLGAEIAPALRQALEDQAGADGIRYRAPDHPRAEVFLGAYADGTLWLGDKLYGPAEVPDSGPSGAQPGPLIRIPRLSTSEQMARGARGVLRHYARYVRPLRLTQRGGYSLDPGLVQIQVVPCPDAARMKDLLQRPAEGQPLARDNRGRVRLRLGDSVAFVIKNTSTYDLHFALLGCAASGKVQHLSCDVGADIGQRSRRAVGWFDRKTATVQPFPARLAKDFHLSFAIDRLVVFAASDSQLAAQVARLAFNETFESALAAALRKSTDGVQNNRGDSSSPVWTVSSLEIQLGEPAAPV